MTEEEIEQIENPLEQFRKEWEAYRRERNIRLQKFFRRVLAIFALLGVTVSITAYFTWQTSQDVKEGLCALRLDAERRVAAGNDFLKDHPNGFAGISAAQLRVGIKNASDTVDSLSHLDCPAPTS